MTTTNPDTDPLGDFELRRETLTPGRTGNYRKADVDRLLDHVQAGLQLLAQRERNLHDQLEDTAAGVRALEATVASRDRSLRTVQQQVDELRSGAADDIVQMRVTERMADAQVNAERIEDTARARAQQIISDARNRAAQMLAGAPALAAQASEGDVTGIPARPTPTGDRVDDALARARWLEALGRYLADERTAALSDISAASQALLEAETALRGESVATGPDWTPSEPGEVSTEPGPF